MAYSWAMDRDASITSNPAHDASAPRAEKNGEGTDEDQRWFSEDEVSRFFARGKPSGLRSRRIRRPPLPYAWPPHGRSSITLDCVPGEVRALSWDDLDLSASPPTLHVRHGQQHVGGKLIARGKTKNKASVRKLAVPADLLPWLEAHKALQAGAEGAVCTRRHMEQS